MVDQSEVVVILCGKNKFHTMQAMASAMTTMMRALTSLWSDLWDMQTLLVERRRPRRVHIKAVTTDLLQAENPTVMHLQTENSGEVAAVVTEEEGEVIEVIELIEATEGVVEDEGDFKTAETRAAAILNLLKLSGILQYRQTQQIMEHHQVQEVTNHHLRFNHISKIRYLQSCLPISSCHNNIHLINHKCQPGHSFLSYKLANKHIRGQT